MPRVFISRELQPDSPFLALSAEPSWVVQAESLVEFAAVPPPGDVPVADWLFFYSTKGVQFFLAQATPPMGTRLAALGPGTAAALAQAGYPPDFVGTGEPSATAALFLPFAAAQHVVFIQARHSRRAIQQHLNTRIRATEWVVYDNIPKSIFDIFPCDYLVFTSPLNVQAYARRYAWPTSVRVVSIGGTTSAALIQAGMQHYRQAPQPSEAALLTCIREWENQ